MKSLKTVLSKFVPKKQIWGIRFLMILMVTLLFVNIISVKLFPKALLSVSAASIDANQLVALANSERTSRGLSPLVIDSRLVEAAKKKGDDMIAKDYWAHYGPNGESPWQFILAEGYDYVFAGENLAKDFSSTVPIHNAWMESPSHRANILNSNYKDIGIAMITGEFQGEETTIVVQMFGSVREKVQPSQVISTPIEEPEYVPEVGTEDTLQTPIIQQPQDGDILNDGAFSVRGEAYEGNYVDIYDKDSLISQIEVNEMTFSYAPTNSFKDGVHELWVVARDSDGRSSLKSNLVSVTVDTIQPYIVSDSFALRYVEVGNDFRNHILSVQVEDNPIRVEAIYEDVVYEFHLVDGVWECSINDTDGLSGDIVISAIDEAGNSEEVIFPTQNLASVISSSDAIEVKSNKLPSWLFENIFTRIFTRSLQGQINFVITFFMLILVTLERFVLVRTGMTKTKPVSLLHIPLFAVLLFVSVLGGGGQIL